VGKKRRLARQQKGPNRTRRPEKDAGPETAVKEKIVSERKNLHGRGGGSRKKKGRTIAKAKGKRTFGAWQKKKKEKMVRARKGNRGEREGEEGREFTEGGKGVKNIAGKSTTKKKKNVPWQKRCGGTKGKRGVLER